MNIVRYCLSEGGSKWIYIHNNFLLSLILLYMHQMLLTKELLRMFAQVGSQERVPDPIIIAKFFTPWTSFTWYATEFSPRNGGTFFGYVTSGYAWELGYFSLIELQTTRWPHWLMIERDIFFAPTRLSNIRR